MLKLIEDRLGRDVMTEVACWFQHPFVRDEAAAQKVPVARAASTADDLSPPIRQAIRLFEPTSKTAPHPDVGRRRRPVGPPLRTPVQARDRAKPAALLSTHLRLAKARQRVLYSNDSLRDIAASVGYLTSSPMIRHYTELFGVSPRTNAAHPLGPPVRPARRSGRVTPFPKPRLLAKTSA